MMSRLAALLLMSGLAGSAAAQPRLIEIKGSAIPPGQVEEIAKRLKEDVALMEAQRDIKREYVKAAEVQLDLAKRKWSLIEKTGNQTSALEKLEAQGTVDLAMAQLEVKKAELKESELKVAHAKRHLESGVFPLVLTPVPAPASFPAPKRPADEVSALEAKVQAKKADLEKAKANVALAKAEYDRVKQLFDKGTAAQVDVDKAAAALAAAEAQLKVSQAELAEAEAVLKAAQPAAPKVNTPPKNPQSKLPASVPFPTAQNSFDLARIDLEVANLRFEVAQVELKQLEAIGVTGEQMDAAKLRYAEAKKGLHAAEDKVLAAQKKLEPVGK